MTASNAEPCELLEWDTTFFGFRIARVIGDRLTPERVERIDAWCRRHDVKCLYFLACADDAATTRLAEDHHFRFVDIRLTFAHKSLSQTDTVGDHPAGLAVRRAHLNDVSALQSIARDSHHDTRFFYDAHFPPRLSRSLYEAWIKLSLEGFANVVLVAEIEGQPVGYISCHLNGHHGKIGLVGVSQHTQGHGIAQSLVLSALDWFAAQEAEDVTVVTQGRNCAAQRLYQRCGFLTQDVQVWYHKWYALPNNLPVDT